MELTRSVVQKYAAEYRSEEPLYTVESEQIETLPGAFSAGEFGRRDAEWVVRWYFRRFLGDVSDADRRSIEDRFADNDFEETIAAIETAATEDVETALEALCGLDGVDVPVASAFLLFVDPDSYVVVGEREWTVLEAAGELTEPYPDPLTREEYLRYLRTCRSIADRLGCDLWTLYMAIWRLWKTEYGS